ncbi:hypothetical protein U6A24_18290 [Aquimarina gracilis]|uniref:Uncharacterized protein n=1 Tax=Aquimarina gracilis TaxID=874422 RepID=A0ABU6A031_9FLAO|nr:hypothetical protein [Aquimarina gracilis]MEB3347431.1 hypothetical protein [Aquimarina gracilis]
MQKTCAPAPTNKKEYIADIGKILVAEHGKKKYYKPEEVKKAHRKSKWYDGLDFSCWGMSTYSSHSDFDSYHEQTGEVCNYIEMKTEMLSGLSNTTDVNWMEIPDLDIDASWLDFGDVFEGVLEGIGEFISAIFEGLSG